VGKFNVVKPANSKHRSKVISDAGTFVKDALQMAVKQESTLLIAFGKGVV